MSKFTVEFKETILTKLLDGDYTSITALAQHYNISKSTLYKWQTELKAGSNDNDMKNKTTSKKTNSKTKSPIPVNKLSEAQKKLNIIIA
ncbi:transposase, partial [Thorsellia anophelis]